MRYFVDTSAFIALEDRSDSRHPDAKRFYETLVPSDRLLTSNYVVDETNTRLRYTIGHEAAVRFADAILKGRLFHLLYVDSEIERAAVSILKKFKDKKLSFTDCTTLALSDAHRVDAIFAFDEDFSRAGVRAVP